MTVLIQMIQTMGSFILVLGILVFVHEFGHFIVAKLLKIGAPVFSLGFGPRIFGFKGAETDYRVSLIPLGGYVRLLGDEADDNRTGSPEEFLSRPKWHRFLVFVAGAVFNIILAVSLMWMVIWSYGREEIGSYPVVGQVLQDSNADRSGIRQGDRILSISGNDARDPYIELEEILMSPNKVKSVLVERDDRQIEFELDTGSEPKHGMGFPGWDLVRETPGPTMVVRVIDGEPADRAGLKVEDRILGADGQEPITEVALRALLASSQDRDVRLKVERGEEILELVVRPREVDGRGKIGVQFYTIAPRTELGIAQSLRASLQANLEWSSMLFLTLKKFTRGEISARAFSGPIEIAQVSRQAIISGWEGFLTFLAFISLQLGILNLLPIPVLDGGHILILGVESTIRRDLSDRIKERVMQAGLALLLTFIVVVLYFDVLKAWFS